jgi:tRNA threonylcarbamoyl adenosine modification protein YeaZ
MTTLCLDTTNNKLMMALGQGNNMLAKANVVCDSHRYHSALIIPAIQDMLNEARLSVKDISALAVNQGPGSFTGIRTGIITARTMAQFLNLPVYVFNQFELLAFGISKPLAVYLDALRGRAYHSIIQFSDKGISYQISPTLRVLDQAAIPDGFEGEFLVSLSLSAGFPPDLTRVIADDFFSPMSMLQLIQAHGDSYLKPWQQVRPLYLQEPSITVRKPSIGG